jgi:dihydroflavonol-4-reductase
LGDLADKTTIENTLFRAMKACKVVYNLAVCGSSLKRHYHLRRLINVEAVKTIAQLARRLNSLRLIHVSSSTAVGYPNDNEIADENFVFNAYNDDYALTKYLGEQAVLREVEGGLDAVIANPCSVLGPHGMKTNQANVFKNIAQGKMWIYPSGGLCLTYIDDLVRGLFLCYEKGVTGKRYILGGHNITYKQYFHEIAHATKGRSPFIRLPRKILSLLCFSAETFLNLLNKEATVNKDVALMISKNLFYSSELAKKQLGYTITDWREAIKDTVRQLKV